MKTFKEALAKRNFVITAEGFLKPETDAEAIRYQADLLRDHVDGVLLTDHQFGALHISTVAAARLMLDNNVDPIVQLSCRNQNRISLLGDLTGAAALGVTSMLLIHGNRLPKNVSPRPKNVLDVNATELIAMAASLNADNLMRPAPDLLVGCSATPHDPKAGWRPQKLLAKVEAGARFMLTHTCMDIDLLRRYMKRMIAAKITHKLSIVVSIVIFTSAEEARWLRDNRPNVLIPDLLIDRLGAASDPRQEGLDIGVEQLTQLAQIPGISGVNIMASQDLASIPAVIEAADLPET